MDATEDEERQRVFYGHVRETIVSILCSLALFSGAWLCGVSFLLLLRV